MMRWTKMSLLAVAAPAAFALGSPVTLLAQATVAPATLHGKITSPTGTIVKSGDVKMTTDKTGAEKDRKFPYDFPIGADGTFKGDKIAPGDYLVVVFSDGKSIDFQNVVLKAGEDRTLDFDMTRAEYMKALSPEERAAIEENKKRNASATAENAKIADINKALLQARTDIKGGKADDAVKEMTDLTTQRPTEPVLWATLGEAQLASGDAAVKAAKAAKTPANDPAILQKYSDAAASYQKAIDLNAQSKKPSPELTSSSSLNMGQALAKEGKTKEASDAYEAAVKASPTMAGTAYFNEAAVLFNAGKLDEAAAAADKAIAADPKKSEAYYIKGAALVPKATLDAKTQKFVLPPGCLEAYQEYLELDPNGAHAPEVKDLLVNLGQPVKNSFKAGKK